MGCDIKLHVEVKIKDSWHHYSCPIIKRNYQLFGIMSGVRNYNNPIVMPKGLPKGVTKLTLTHFTNDTSKSHHTSWFNYDEIKILDKTLSKIDGVLYDLFIDSFGLVFDYHITNKKNLKEYFNIDDVRLVFWFDN